MCATNVIHSKRFESEHSNAEFGMRNSELKGDTFARPNKLRNRKHLQSNALVLLRLFLLSPKSFLRNTFRGAPIFAAALYVIIASSLLRTRFLKILAVGMTCLFVILSLSKYLKQATERALDLRLGMTEGHLECTPFLSSRGEKRRKTFPV